MTPYTVSGASVAALVTYSQRQGLDLSSTLRQTGLHGVDLTDPGLRIPVDDNDALWEAATVASGDVDFGLHFAQHLDLDAFHVVGHLAATSRDLGHALERVVAFSRLLHDAGRTELEREAGVIRFYPGCRGLPVPPPRQVAEYVVASFVTLCQALTGQPLRPMAVHFEHDAPPRTTAHVAILGVEPRFRALETFIVLDAEQARWPIRAQGPTAVGRYLESYATALLHELGEAPTDLVDQVRRAIIAGLQSGNVELEPVARRLGMSPRTLQRRLAASDSRYADLLDQARHKAAVRYLMDGQMPLGEVSYLLGFSEPSNFHRAFRRWTGLTPGEFVKECREAAPPPA